MKKIFTLLMVLCLGLSFSTLALAEGKRGPEKKDDMESKICKKMKVAFKHGEELGLTDDQKGQMKDLKIKLKKEMIQYKAKIETLKVDIKAELWNDDIDQVKIDKYINEKYDLKKAKAKSLVAYLISFKAILSEAQMKQLKGYCMKGKK